MNKNTIYVGVLGLVIILLVSYFLYEKELPLKELLFNEWKINIEEVDKIYVTYYDNDVNNSSRKDFTVERKDDIERLLLSSETMQLKRAKNNRKINEKHFNIIVRLSNGTQVSFWIDENIIFNNKSTYSILDENTFVQSLKQLLEVN